MHTAYDAVEDALLKAFVIKGEIGRRRASLDDGTEVVCSFEDAEGLCVAGRGSGGDIFGEAIFSINGVPDVCPCIAGEPLGILYQTDIVAFGGCTFIFWDTIIPIIAFVVVLHHTALSDIVSQRSLQRSLTTSFLLQFSTWMCSLGSL